jgi:type II secretory ATPase GspE/PulE/Tfp pilus assembly ATPase PilB-like protein
LEIDEPVRDEIMRRASAASIANAARGAGRLTTLRDSAAELVASRVTTPGEALSAVKTA